MVENAHSPFYVEFEVFSTSGQSADPLRSLISCHKPILEERVVVYGYLGGNRTEEVKGKVSVRCELIQMMGPVPSSALEPSHGRRAQSPLRLALGSLALD